MDLFLKAVAAALITAVLGLVLFKQGKDISVLLTLGVCCMIWLCAMEYLGQILDFLNQLEKLTGLDHDVLSILLKIVGLGLVGELASGVCCDAGNSALGKVLQLLSTVMVLWLSLPLFETLLSLLRTTLEDL